MFDAESESRRRYGLSYRQSSGEGRGGEESRYEGVKERREGGKQTKETLKGRRADKETKLHYSDDIDQLSSLYSS